MPRKRPTPAQRAQRKTAKRFNRKRNQAQQRPRQAARPVHRRPALRPQAHPAPAPGRSERIRNEYAAAWEAVAALSRRWAGAIRAVETPDPLQRRLCIGQAAELFARSQRVMQEAQRLWTQLPHEDRLRAMPPLPLEWYEAICKTHANYAALRPLDDPAHPLHQAFYAASLSRPRHYALF